jgi:hypothetical protein
MFKIRPGWIGGSNCRQGSTSFPQPLLPECRREVFATLCRGTCRLDPHKCPQSTAGRGDLARVVFRGTTSRTAESTPMRSVMRRPSVLFLALSTAATALALLSATADAATAPTADSGASAKWASTTSNRTPDASGRRFERWATITKIPLGYYYDAGQQNTHLVVTEVKGGLRYADRHTDVLRSKPDSCHRKPAKVGLVVVCHVPRDVSRKNPMRVKVFTRLGNDYVNTSALPKKFRLYGLCDQGDDTYIGGAGNDFINGAPGRDHVYGGPGNDLVRGGENHDVVFGGPGNDRVVGLDGPDKLRGGSGNDRVGGGRGDDHLYAGAGTDLMVCHQGNDWVYAQRTDRIITQYCEHIRYVSAH